MSAPLAIPQVITQHAMERFAERFTDAPPADVGRSAGLREDICAAIAGDLAGLTAPSRHATYRVHVGSRTYVMRGGAVVTVLRRAWERRRRP